MTKYKMLSLRELMGLELDVPKGTVFLCKNCEHVIDPSWKYCPICGEPTGFDIKFKLKGVK